MNLYYVLSVTCAVLLLVGLVLVDVGAVKRGSMLHSAVQKMIGLFIGVLAHSVIGRHLCPRMTETSIGLLMGNFFMAITGGTLVGVIIAYRTRKSFYMLLGSLGGYLAAVPGFDVYTPWQMFLISLPAPSSSMR